MIYLCDQKGSPNDLDSARYVIKIEPKKNGPLFTEINYYQRNCKEVEIDKYFCALLPQFKIFIRPITKGWQESSF